MIPSAYMCYDIYYDSMRELKILLNDLRKFFIEEKIDVFFRMHYKSRLISKRLKVFRNKNPGLT